MSPSSGLEPAALWLTVAFQNNTPFIPNRYGATSRSEFPRHSHALDRTDYYRVLFRVPTTLLTPHSLPKALP